MINIVEKKDCCGCSACVSKCPKQCISMIVDNEGFSYPYLDKENCIDCGLCEKVCPVINQNEPKKPLRCYAAINPDENIRVKSSSGGIFTMIAEYIIAEGGVVFGAAWNKNWQVEHTYTEVKEGLKVFRGSKYIQSIIGDSFIQVELFLKVGRKVLFSGTPCQIAGLKKFLRKEYNNLITVDFVCHGVPSPGVFRWYMKEELKRYSDYVIKDIRFRDKCEGWKNFSFSIDLENIDSKECVTLSQTLHECSFLVGFLNNYYLRPSCHYCPAKQFKSSADITLADYWGYNQSDKIKDDDKGVSAIFISTKEGDRILHMVEPLYETVEYSDILRINGAVEHSAQAPYREYFYSHSEMPFKTIIEKLVSEKILNKARRKLYFLTHKHEYYKG
ncbi:Coenzyme F420 hydrogenase/dehydrogenase, beta subunit C-terminal domain [Bacteroides acidifaciens]|uniref:4Fe-4S dicluster domain-containing protein n=2 Tax=Bacteroides acidifaciens TaxID=85831 RepID=A0A7K3MEI7_9BACE|nr:Coenzyme F420 hydrogenase/dehydrogenase, beta subunit C-terminal domain [Bacteroides acidifaciens]MBF0729229.1 Coenzyme F420 hydrogenase/dehydrogenase, beta subunit C-terminal domain [Bacteroides acidifaciens]MBF0834590.1 Coenzyme F420 hydrogenase/dehydrogenase, beta subunit C-terminal domain [Bacteroides acidifaciens]NDO52664.1 4Fe-4S dicluster domain-containing protein [Bacteroides acidifaciens]TFU50494.1 4Fe-4S dicluster domain-containing protein [Bacteroides acidifaciens]